MTLATNGNASDECLEDLLRKVAAQDRQAFAVLYQATSSKLFAVLIRVLKDKDRAADTLQDVYLTIWRRASSFDPSKGKALSWMAIITRNAAIDLLRKRQTWPLGDDRVEEIPATERSAFQSVSDANAQGILRQRILSLPHKQRRAVTLFYLEEHSIAETANELGAPLNTTKSWVRRGLQRLRTDFSDLSATDLVA